MAATSDRVTTVKVPRSLRERIARNAAVNGQTAAAFLSEAVDRLERHHRLKAVRDAYSNVPDDSYRVDTEAWDATAGDGVDV